MEITEVRIYRKEDDDKKLRAFATVTLDHCFVVRDIKIIEGAKGLFVAMPSRRVKEPCPRCRHRNVIRSHYCNQCGAPLEPGSRSGTERMGELVRQSEHRDVAHPVTAECREYIQKAVLEAYEHQKAGIEDL